jgi:3-hydroxyisobutyrate dehydrogenase-like beta-hydroxyacid dehydrogenase
MTTKDFGRIAWIGTGKLGLPMAARIAAAGHDIVAYDVSDERVTEAKRRKLVTAPFVADAVKGAKAVFTSLPDDKTLLTAVAGAGGLISLMPADAILVETSTVSPEASADVAKAAAQRSIAYVRSPVSGNPVSVEAGIASVLCSGPQDAWETIRPIVAAFSKSQKWLGTSEQARYAKLAVNLGVVVTSGMIAEALVMAEKGGLSRHDMLEVLCESVMGSPFMKYKAPPLEKGDYTPTFTCRQMIKDIDLILGACEATGVPAPLTAIMRQQYSALISRGYENEDFIATVRLTEELSGWRRGGV